MKVAEIIPIDTANSSHENGKTKIIELSGKTDEETGEILKEKMGEEKVGTTSPSSSSSSSSSSILSDNKRQFNGMTECGSDIDIDTGIEGSGSGLKRSRREEDNNVNVSEDISIDNDDGGGNVIEMTGIGIGKVTLKNDDGAEVAREGDQSAHKEGDGRDKEKDEGEEEEEEGEEDEGEDEEEEEDEEDEEVFLKALKEFEGKDIEDLKAFIHSSGL